MSVPTEGWDFAGVDGQEVARTLFGEPAARLSVWQSLDMNWNETPCSVLRLCEGNFRISLSGGDGGVLELALAEASQGERVWIKPCRLAGLIAQDRPEDFLPLATVKLPHRLAGLPPGHAVPARLGGCAVLLWRHTVAGRPVLEVQAATGDLATVREMLCQGGLL